MIHIDYKTLFISTHHWILANQTKNSAVGPCIPYLGVYLSDLTFIDEGNLDYVKDNKLINFEKRALSAKVITEIQLFQQMQYCFRPMPFLQSYLTNLKMFSESEAYKLSLEYEPRESTWFASFFVLCFFFCFVNKKR